METLKIILPTIVGAIIGFTAPFIAKLWEKLIRSKRMKLAIIRELSDANEQIKEKLTWIGRDVSDYLDEVQEDGIVMYEGKHLYLGEPEEFVVSQKYWDEKFIDAVEVLSEHDYAYLSESNRLVTKFVEKFKQMKIVFKTKHGKKDSMASACYEDLIDISSNLEKRLTNAYTRPHPPLLRRYGRGG